MEYTKVRQDVEGVKKKDSISTSCFESLRNLSSEHMRRLEGDASFRTNHTYDLLERIKRLSIVKVKSNSL